MMGLLIGLLHPFRWLKYFLKAMLYGPDYSPYEEMAQAYNREQGLGQGSGSGGARVRLRGRPRLVDSDGYSDKEDESYYGM